MTRLVLGALLWTLAACGVDGPPEPVQPMAGVTVSGTAKVGVSGSF